MPIAKRYVIIMGGRGAGRSYETSQKITAKLFQTTRRFRAAIMRAIHADIRHLIWQELSDRVNTWNIETALRVADSTMEMEHGQNSVHAHGFKKSSSDRTAKLKSLAGYTDAFIEEAEEIGEDEFRQLDDSLRTEGSQIHLLLNTPAKNHWIIRRWFDIAPCPDAPGFYTIALKPGVEDVEFIFSHHQDNPYLSESVHQRYESYQFLKPAYYWQMIRGLCPEVVMGRIYKGWREIPAVPQAPIPRAQAACHWHLLRNAYFFTSDLAGGSGTGFEHSPGSRSKSKVGDSIAADGQGSCSKHSPAALVNCLEHSEQHPRGRHRAAEADPGLGRPPNRHRGGLPGPGVARIWEGQDETSAQTISPSDSQCYHAASCVTLGLGARLSDAVSAHHRCVYPGWARRLCRSIFRREIFSP